MTAVAASDGLVRVAHIDTQPPATFCGDTGTADDLPGFHITNNPAALLGVVGPFGSSLIYRRMFDAVTFQMGAQPHQDGEQVERVRLRQVAILDPHPSPAGDRRPQLPARTTGVPPRDPRCAAGQGTFTAARAAARDGTVDGLGPRFRDGVQVSPDAGDTSGADQPECGLMVAAEFGAVAVGVGMVAGADDAGRVTPRLERDRNVVGVPFEVD